MPNYSNYGASAYANPRITLAMRGLAAADPKNRESMAAALDAVNKAIALDAAEEEAAEALENHIEELRKINEVTKGNLDTIKSLREDMAQLQRIASEQNAIIEDALKTRRATDAMVADAPRRMDEWVAQQMLDQVQANARQMPQVR